MSDLTGLALERLVLRDLGEMSTERLVCRFENGVLGRITEGRECQKIDLRLQCGTREKGHFEAALASINLRNSWESGRVIRRDAVGSKGIRLPTLTCRDSGSVESCTDRASGGV